MTRSGVMGSSRSRWESNDRNDTPRHGPRFVPPWVSDALDTVAERLKTAGVTIVSPDRRSADYLKRFVESEVAKWGVIIKANGVSLE